jgi:hypothetical protein
MAPRDRWRHSSGISNQADTPSRGLSLIELIHNETCFAGPEWWRSFEDDQDPPEQNNFTRELKRTEENEIGSTLLNTPEFFGIENKMRVQDYSDVKRLFFFE